MWEALFVCNYKHIHVSSYKNEIYAARARDLYIIIHYPDEHFKLNFEWKDGEMEHWKRKLTTKRNMHKWIQLKPHEEILAHTKRMTTALENDNILLLGKLNNILDKKNKARIDYETEILGISSNFREEILTHTTKMLNTLFDNNILLSGKLQDIQNKKYKSRIDYETKILGITYKL